MSCWWSTSSPTCHGSIATYGAESSRVGIIFSDTAVSSVLRPRTSGVTLTQGDLMRDQVLNLARKLCETDDIHEARDIAGELQRAVREVIEDLGMKLYWRKMRAAGQGHPTNVVEMPRKTKF